MVTSFEFKAHPVGPMVFVGATFYPFEDAPTILPAWRDFMLAACPKNQHDVRDGGPHNHGDQKTAG